MTERNVRELLQMIHLKIAFARDRLRHSRFIIHVNVATIDRLKYNFAAYTTLDDKVILENHKDTIMGVRVYEDNEIPYMEFKLYVEE